LEPWKSGSGRDSSSAFADEKFSGKVTHRAFNSLISLNDRDSSLPATFRESNALLKRSVKYRVSQSKKKQRRHGPT
jgi:hypothetical protein